MLDRLQAEGIVVEEGGRDRTWESFAGWRVDYDRTGAGLCVRVGDVPMHWTADRSWSRLAIGTARAGIAVAAIPARGDL